MGHLGFGQITLKFLTVHPCQTINPSNRKSHLSQPAPKGLPSPPAPYRLLVVITTRLLLHPSDVIALFRAGLRPS